MARLTREEAITHLKQLAARTNLILAIIDLQPEENIILHGTKQPFVNSPIYEDTVAKIKLIEASIK